MQKVVSHKVNEAYRKIKKPVIVEDSSLEIKSLGKLPGTFIKFFLQELSFEKICELPYENREAVAKVGFGYFDGKVEKYFEKEMQGTISLEAKGNNGFGWDRFFIPEGHNITRSEMNDDDYKKTYFKIKPFDELKAFLKSL